MEEVTTICADCGTDCSSDVCLKKEPDRMSTATVVDVPHGTLDSTPAISLIYKAQEEAAIMCGKGHEKVNGKCPKCGRPEKTLAILEPKWNEMFKNIIGNNGSWVDTQDWAGVVKWAYSEGASDVEIKVMLRVSNDLWDRLLRDEQKFSETIAQGRQMAEAWWVRTGRTELKNKDFSYQGFRINMANRFDWREKTQEDITSKGDKIDGLAVSFVKPKE